jgi:hypothetical protein
MHLVGDRDPERIGRIGGIEMTVLVIYVLLVAVAEVIVALVGIAADAIIASGWNLILAMTMFLGVLWAMWPVSVYITERWFNGAEKPGAQTQPTN